MEENDPSTPRASEAGDGGDCMSPFSRDRMLAYTARNPYDRFEDGRPQIPSGILDQLHGVCAEEAWEVLWRAGYQNQFEGNWMLLHPGRKLVGRAFTARFMPSRPDIEEADERSRRTSLPRRNANQRVIDRLGPGDVLVVDLFGKREGGTFAGDILAAAIYAATGTGIVIDGAIRDLEGIVPLGMPGYVRSVHPTPLHQVALTGINVPVRIGGVTVMPGDAVLGDREGVFFIPPELAGKVVEHAKQSQVRDEWMKSKLGTGKYRSSDIYPTPGAAELLQEFEDLQRKPEAG